MANDINSIGLQTLQQAKLQGNAPQDNELELKRQAAGKLAEAEKQTEASKASGAGVIQLGSTLLGALIGGIATGFNPAGFAAGAGIGGALGSVGGAVVNPSAQTGAGAAAGLAGGESAYQRLLALMKQQEEGQFKEGGPYAEELGNVTTK